MEEKINAYKLLAKRENLRKNYFADLDVDVRIILKRILKE